MNYFCLNWQAVVAVLRFLSASGLRLIVAAIFDKE